MAGSSDLRDITIADARDALAAGELSARELTNAFLEAIEEERHLNAFITETPDRALADADASDARRAKGETLSPLDGIPIAIKDLFYYRRCPNHGRISYFGGLYSVLRKHSDVQSACCRYRYARQNKSR